jgi:hypothetical protein
LPIFQYLANQKMGGEIMANSSLIWRKGRGKLGFLEPLLGTWRAEAETPNGPVCCMRTFTWALHGKYIQLKALWEFEQGTYEEIAYFGVRRDGIVGYWFFTSDGKQSEGKVTDVSDIHPQAVGFEAQMPAGLARMAYWPDEEKGMHWVVEARTKKGWRRFVHHHYHPSQQDEPIPRCKNSTT